MDPHSRAAKKNTSHGNEVLLQDTVHLIQRSCYQRGTLCQDSVGNWTTQRPPDHRNDMLTEVICTCLLFIKSGQNHLVTFILLYACESWTLTAELQWRKQAMEMRCYRKILRISYKDHVTNEEVHAKIQQAIGPHKDLLTIVKRRKPQWYGHASRSSGLAKTILQGTMKGGRRQGRQRKRWEDNITPGAVSYTHLTLPTTAEV